MADRRYYICAGHAPGIDNGAMGNGYLEADLTKELRDLVVAELKARGLKTATDDDRSTLIQVIRAAASWVMPNDIVLDIHFNAAGPTATGVEAFHKVNASAIEKLLAHQLALNVSKVLGIPMRVTKSENQSQHQRLGILHTGALSVLLEVAFISNSNDMASYQRRKRQVATAIVNALLAV